MIRSLNRHQWRRQWNPKKSHWQVNLQQLRVANPWAWLVRCVPRWTVSTWSRWGSTSRSTPTLSVKARSTSAASVTRSLTPETPVSYHMLMITCRRWGGVRIISVWDVEQFSRPVTLWWSTWRLFIRSRRSSPALSAARHSWGRRNSCFIKILCTATVQINCDFLQLYDILLEALIQYIDGL